MAFSKELNKALDKVNKDAKRDAKRYKKRLKRSGKSAVKKYEKMSFEEHAKIFGGTVVMVAVLSLILGRLSK